MSLFKKDKRVKKSDLMIPGYIHFSLNRIEGKEGRFVCMEFKDENGMQRIVLTMSQFKEFYKGTCEMKEYIDSLPKE